jgi:hypothetical protein
MCSYQEWDTLARRVQKAIDEGQVREFVADAAARVELLVEELKGWACTSENSDWASGRCRRSRPEWVA